jgi:hypothetical protein
VALAGYTAADTPDPRVAQADDVSWVIVLQNFKNVFQRFFRVLIHMHGGRIKYKKPLC